MVPSWGRCTHFRTYFSGDSDVHWEYDLDFDPWPYVLDPFSVTTPAGSKMILHDAFRGSSALREDRRPTHESLEHWAT